MMEEFGAGEPSPSRERNINRLMQTFGIQYQLVRPVPPLPSRMRARLLIVIRLDANYSNSLYTLTFARAQLQT